MLIVSLATSILLARVLGPDGRGLLLALTFWPALFSAMLNLSLNEAVAYHVARHTGSSNGPIATAASFQLVVATAVIATLVTILAVYTVVPQHYQGHLELIMIYAAVFVPISHLEQLFRAILQGRGAILSLNAVRLIQPGCYLALLLVLLALGLLDVPAAMAAAIVALAFSLVAGAVLARPALLASRAGLHCEIASTGWTFHKANLLVYAASELDKAIVLVLLTATEAGLFAVAIAVSAIGTGVVLQSLGLMLFRDMATADGDDARRKVFVANMRAAFAVLMLVNGAAAALTPWALPLLYGTSFAAAVPVTVLLLGMGALKGARQMIDRALRATHHTSTGMTGEAISLAGISALGPIGAMTGGIEGLAAAALLSQVTALVVVLGLAKRHLGICLAELWPLHRAALRDLGAYPSRAKSSPDVS